MARWHLTGGGETARRARAVCESAGLETSGSRSGPGYDVRAYGKRAIDATNFVDFGEDGWICSAGTVVSNGELGEAPLREIYRRLSSDGVSAARSGVIGHYAVAAKVGDTVTVFTDPMGAFRLYYAADASPLVVSNSLHVVAESLPSLTVRPIRVVTDAFQQAISTGEETFYEGVNRLFGSQVLTVGLTAGELSIDRLPTDSYEVRNDISAEAVVDRYRSEVRDVFDHLVGIDSVALNATGGLDTRTVLAALLDRGIEPGLIYGVGNSNLTNTKRSDLEASLELAEALDLPHYRMDWSDDHPHDPGTLSELFERHGFLFSNYGTPRSLLRELEGGISPYPRLQLGGYSSAFSKTWEGKRETDEFTFDALVDHWVHDGVEDPAFECEESYRADTADQVRAALDHSPIDYPDRGASLETFLSAQLFLYNRAAADPANLFNEFTYYLAPFLVGRLHDPLMEVPMEYRTDAEFQIRLVHSLAPDLFEVPVFSMLEPRVIDLDSFTKDHPPSYRLRERLRNLAGTVIPGAVKPLVAGAYQRITADPDDETGIDDRIRASNARDVMEGPVTGACFSAVPDVGLPYLNNLQRFAFGVEAVGYDGLHTARNDGDDTERPSPDGTAVGGDR